MITRLRVKNFKSLRDVDVSLGPFTVLVGENAAGKSNLVDALKFVRDALSAPVASAIAARNGFGSIRTNYANRISRHIEIKLTATLDEAIVDYEISIAPDIETGFRIKREAGQVLSKDGQELNAFEFVDGKMRISPSADDSGPSKIVNGMSSMGGLELDSGLRNLAYSEGCGKYFAKLVMDMQRSRFFNLNLYKARTPIKSKLSIKLDEDGENLAEALKGLARSEYAVDIRSAMKEIVDDLSDFRVVTSAGYQIVQLRHGNGFNRGGWHDLAQESDGTVRALAILAAIYTGASYTRLTAIEEPETALHPGALPMLVEHLREASLKRQVLITTQSPDLIDELQPDEIRVVEREAGETKVGPISKTQYEAVRSNLFKPGALMRVDGLKADLAK